MRGLLNITPLSSGHRLVVPRQELDDWSNLEPLLAAHLMSVAQADGKAIMSGFEPEKVGLMIAGLEIPHAHVQVWPIHGPLTIPVDYGDKESPAPTGEARRSSRNHPTGAHRPRLPAARRTLGTILPAFAVLGRWLSPSSGRAG